LDFQREGQYADGLQQIEKGLVLAPDHDALARLRDEVRGQLAAEQQRQAEQTRREQEIRGLLKQAEAQWKAKRLTEPAGDNLEATYRQVLQLDPNNAPARDGLRRIAQEYEQRAQQRRSAGALQDSLEQIDKGLAVVPDHEGLTRLRQEVERGIAEAKARQAREEEQRLQAERFLTQAQSSFQQGALEASLAQIEQGLGVMSGHQALLALREQVKGRMAEQARQQAEAARRQEEEARRQAALAERRQAEQAEQARQQAEAMRRRREAEQYLARAVDYQREGGYADSLRQIEEGLALAPDHAELTRLREDVRGQLAAEQKRQAEQAKREGEIKALLEQAEAHLKAKRLTQPAGNNAQETYRQVLELDAGNAQAQAGFGRIAQEYEQLARQRREAGAWQESLTQIDRGLAVAPEHEGLLRLRQEVSVEWEVERRRLEQQRKEQEQQRLEQQRKEQERQRLEQPRKEQEQQRLEQQRKERQRLEQQRKEQERLKQQQKEQQRLEQQRLEQQRLEQQRLEQQRLEQQQNKQRLEQQQLEKQRQEQQRLEQQRQEKQRQEQLRQDTKDAPATQEKPQRRIFGTF
jgi:serine/threonine-protein kinase PpkA